MAKSLSFNINVKAWLEDASAQFRNLNSKDPSSWPSLPRYALFSTIILSCAVALWFVWLSDKQVELTTCLLYTSRCV